MANIKKVIEILTDSADATQKAIKYDRLELVRVMETLTQGIEGDPDCKISMCSRLDMVGNVFSRLTALETKYTHEMGSLKVIKKALA